MKVEKRNLKVGDIVRTERGDVYCIINLYSGGTFIEENYVLALSSKLLIRSIHADSIVDIVEHTDVIDKLIDKMNRAILYGSD